MDGEIDMKEKIEILDHFVQQLVNSGFGYKQTRDIVISSIKGVKRKEAKQRIENTRYKSAIETLDERLKKKLVEACTWFRNPDGEKDVEVTKCFEENYEAKPQAWKGWRRKKGGKQKENPKRQNRKRRYK